MTKHIKGLDLSYSPYFVYIIRCADGTLYTGTAVDVDLRIAAHNSGKGAKYTRGRLPVSLVYKERHDGKPAALRREIEIKSMSRSKKQRLITAGEVKLSGQYQWGPTTHC